MWNREHFICTQWYTYVCRDDTPQKRSISFVWVLCFISLPCSSSFKCLASLVGRETMGSEQRLIPVRNTHYLKLLLVYLCLSYRTIEGNLIINQFIDIIVALIVYAQLICTVETTLSLELRESSISK